MSLAWSPDGTQFATTPSDPGADNSARLWMAGGILVATLRGDTAPIHCLAWSLDSQLLASASLDGSVRLWDRGGHLVRILRGANPVLSLAWSPDNTILAVGAIQRPPASVTGLLKLPGVVTLWSADGTRLHTVGTQGTGGKFLNLAWSPDGTLLAAGAVDYADWRADASPVAVLRPGGSPAWAMAWAPDSRLLALGDEGGGLQLVTAMGAPVGSASLSSDINALSFAPDDRGLVIGANGQVQFVRPDHPTQVVWTALTANDGQVAWSPDGQRLALAITGGLAILAADGTAMATLTGCPGTPTTVAWSSAALSAATDQRRLCVWPAP